LLRSAESSSPFSAMDLSDRPDIYRQRGEVCGDRTR
jgi:hypothetical protein